MRNALSPTLDWADFETRFPEALASSFSTNTDAVSWPEWAEGELEALTEHYSSPEWNEFR